MKRKIHKNKRISLKEVRIEIWLLLIIIFALFMRSVFFIGLGRRDDIAYIKKAYDVARGVFPLPESSGTWPDPAGTRLMVYFPIAFFFHLFSISEFTASLYFILCSLGSIIIIFLLGKYLFNENTGLIAAFLLSFFPHEVIYSTQITPDIPVAFFLGLTTLFIILAEKRKKRGFYFLSGLIFGIAYMTKEAYQTVGIFISTYLLINLLSKRKLNIKNYLPFILGFLIIFSMDNLFYISQGKDLFTNILVNKKNVMLEKNGNPNLNHYYYMMFNLYPYQPGNRIFGLFYYFVFISILYLLVKDLKRSHFIILWFLVVFLCYQYIASFIAGRTFIEREDKYLAVLSLPALLILSRFLTFNKESETFILPVIVVLLITSIPTLVSAYTFNRAIIEDIRNSYLFLKDLPEKKIFIPEGIYPQMDFFYGYRKSYLLKPYYENVVWKDIKDSYVIVNATPTDVYVWEKDENIPGDWQLLTTLVGHRRSCYDYNTKVYYAP